MAQEHAAHGPSFYVKIWGILLVLLIISILGPMLEHQAITLVTAFGIAVVKATMVCAYFMHLNVEKRYVWYLLITGLLLIGLLFAGVSPDVMAPSGTNWENCVSTGSCGGVQEYIEPESLSVHH